MRLEGKTALITGAGRGLGRACASTFAREGANVALMSRTMAELEETARLVEQEGARALILDLDITDEPAVRTGVDKIRSELGPVTILVNSAAIVGPAAPLHELDPDDWDRTLAVNLGGARMVSQEVIPHMIDSGGGRIVNVTSGMAEIVLPLFGAYGASKAALNHMTRTMAEELRGLEIQVNGLDPGVMDTAMQEEIRGLGPDVLGKHIFEQFNSFKESGHLSAPGDVAELALFLVSDSGVGITGEIGGAAEFKDYGYGL
jgi:NAD(P)-dependent dehydrogenase (short-subunit alcohol dehydrogenase family)